MARKRSRLAERARRNPNGTGAKGGRLFDPEREYGEGGEYRRFSAKRGPDKDDPMVGGAGGGGAYDVIRQNQVNRTGNERKGGVYDVVKRRSDGMVGHRYGSAGVVWLGDEGMGSRPEGGRRGAARGALAQIAQPARTDPGSIRQAFDQSPERSSSLIELLDELRVAQSVPFKTKGGVGSGAPKYPVPPAEDDPDWDPRKNGNRRGRKPKYGPTRKSGMRP